MSIRDAKQLTRKAFVAAIATVADLQIHFSGIKSVLSGEEGDFELEIATV